MAKCAVAKVDTWQLDKIWESERKRDCVWVCVCERDERKGKTETEI